MLLATVALLGIAGGVSAQSLAFKANKEFMSEYIWRGMINDPVGGPGASFDTGLSFTSADQNLFVETYFWTYQSFHTADHYSEYQFTAYANYRGFFLEFNNYFPNIIAGNTGEIGIGYELDWTVPVSLALYTSIYGDDYSDSGKRNFSQYLELDIPYSIGNFDIQATFGALTHKSPYYENPYGFAVNHMMLEAGYTFYPLAWLSIPIKAGVGYAPIYDPGLRYYGSIGLGILL